MGSYAQFLDHKAQLGTQDGFDPVWMPEFLFDFQRALVEWATLKGKAAIFADCGLGKTPMQLVWAENVVRKTNKPVLILTPLAVSHQTVTEAEKFGIAAVRSTTGKPGNGITITNYEQLHRFSPSEIGIELKDSYYRQALKNVKAAYEGRRDEEQQSLVLDDADETALAD